MIELKDYQIQAVEKLKASVEDALKSSEIVSVIFQAPTGSGKTVMVSELLKELVMNRKDDKKFSFVWVSVRMLHEQSKEKLEKYYEDDRFLKCSYFGDLEDRKIGENEILFINWHSINKKDINIFVRENEQDNNLNGIIQNTKEEGREIILVIDESHHTASSEKSIELIEVISPKVTIEVSATPHLKENIGGWVKVNLGDVKAEEMIKSEIAVNPEFLNIKVGTRSSDEIVIEQALRKREELAQLFKKVNVAINPLVLIQLPDQKGNLINKKEDILKILKDKFNITENNGKLAVWLSEEKTETLINVEKYDNEVEVLIFKQAIALGWDCPRASILVIFRESKSFIFTIQTIGRIMRMPELKYYNDAELNKGFVFTNLANIEITEDYAKDYLTIYESKRDNSIYDNISIPSIYLKRQRERTRLSGKFVQVFSKVAEVMNLKQTINLEPSTIVSPVIADGRIIDIDKAGEITHKGQINIQLNESELRRAWDKFITQNCTPYAPVDSSDRMKTALYQFFKENFGFDKYDSKVQRIVLGKENVQIFVDTINSAKERYNREIIEQLSGRREMESTPKWEVPLMDSFNGFAIKEEYIKSIMKPFYSKKPSTPEIDFMKLLDNSTKLKWWYKNRESEIKYFAVLRPDGQSFYPDFIVQFKDSSIGIFDTKSGMTAKDAKERAEGLQKLISEQKKKGKNIWGGIVIYINGSWRYNDNESYSYDPNNLKDWKFLELN